MGKLTTELKTAIEKAQLYPLATCSKDGIPNVIPIKFIFIEDDDHLWLVDNFMSKTQQNLEENPHAAINIWVDEDNVYLQLKGRTRIETTGNNVQLMREKVHAIKPDAPAKALVIFEIDEIYQCLPGPNIGQRLD